MALGVDRRASTRLRHRARHHRREEADRVRQELTESLEATLNSIAEGVIATGADGVVARMNPVAERLTDGPRRRRSVGRSTRSSISAKTALIRIS